MPSMSCARFCGQYGLMRLGLGRHGLRQPRLKSQQAVLQDGHVVTDAAAVWRTPPPAQPGVSPFASTPAAAAGSKSNRASSSNGKHAGARGGGQLRPAAAAPAESVPCFHELFQGDAEQQQQQQHGQQHKQHRRRRSAAADPAAAHVRVSIVRAVEYGQSLALVGAPAALGGWRPDHALPLAWHEGHRWAADVALPAGSHEFKFVLQRRSGTVEWEPGANRVVSVPSASAQLQVQGSWGATQETEVLLLAPGERAAAASERDTPSGGKQRRKQRRAPEHAAGEAMPHVQVEQHHALAAAAAEGRVATTAAPAPAAAEAGEPGGDDAAAGNALWAAFSAAAARAVQEHGAPGGRDELRGLLLGMRDDMAASLAGVTSTMQEMADELQQVQASLALLQAERRLSGGWLDTDGGGAMAGLAAAAGSAAAANASSAAGHAVQPARCEDSGTASGTNGDAGGELVHGDGALLLAGLHSTVLSWRQELLLLRRESLEVRQQLGGVSEALQAVESQLAANSDSVARLEGAVVHKLQQDSGVLAALQQLAGELRNEMATLSELQRAQVQVQQLLQQRQQQAGQAGETGSARGRRSSGRRSSSVSASDGGEAGGPDASAAAGTRRRRRSG